MGKSATRLGEEYGLTGEEMNVVLKEEGYLDGEPSEYYVTSKGDKYAHEEDFHRGTGGSPWYNRNWTQRTWDDDIIEDLEVTDEVKQRARETVAERRRLQREERKVAQEEAEREFLNKDDTSDESIDFEDSNEYDQEYESRNSNKVRDAITGFVIVVVFISVVKGFKWIKNKITGHDKTYICPNKYCKGSMHYVSGYDYWECEDCYLKLTKEELTSGVKLCYCGECHSCLNSQEGYLSHIRKWKCIDCGTVNIINRR